MLLDDQISDSSANNASLCHYVSGGAILYFSFRCEEVVRERETANNGYDEQDEDHNGSVGEIGHS